MEWVETTGRTVEDAKEAALDQLGIDESEAEFEIIEEPKTGLFGRVRADARLRARVAPKSPRPKQERRPRRQRSGGAGPGGAGADEQRDAVAPEGASEEADAPRQPDTEGVAARTDGRRGGGRNRPTPKSGGSSAREQEGRQMSDEVVPVGTQADMVTEFLEGLLDALGADGTVARTQVDEDTIELAVTGDDLGLLIGPKGQTLTAVHELSRTVLQRRATGRHEGRVRIDIGGYRHRRQEALARFATSQAQEVLSAGAARALEPMNAADRKVVHDTVNDIDGVATLSEGVDPERRVVLVPEGAEA